MQTISHSTTLASEAQLISAARLGETSGLVEYLYEKKLMSRAMGLVSGFRDAYGVYLDADDVAMEGVVHVLRGLDKALAEAVNPVAWLVRVARLKMLHYCQEQRGPIRVPACQQWRGARVPQVSSLDAPLQVGENLTLLDLLPAT